MAGGPVVSFPPPQWDLGIEVKAVGTQFPGQVPQNAPWGSLTEVNAGTSWRTPVWGAAASGLCAGYGRSARDPKPSNVWIRQEKTSGAPTGQAATGFSCLLRQAYLEGTQRRLTWSVGKKAWDFSQSLFSSPSHPGFAGVGRLADPTAPQEGFLSIQVHGPVSPTTSMTLGFVANELSPEDGVFPLARWKIGFSTFDASLVLANRFLGFGLAQQTTDRLLVYGEGNIHAPERSDFGSLEVKADGLWGASYHWPSRGITGVLEYLRTSSAQEPHSLGTHPGNPLDPTEPQDRQKVYGFPTVSLFQKQLNLRKQSSNIESRDVLFAHFRGSKGSGSVWPKGAFIYSLNDKSSLSEMGFTLAHSPQFSASWQHTRGKTTSWFGGSAQRQGRNRFLISLSYESP